jgi:hypothetical protein
MNFRKQFQVVTAVPAVIVSLGLAFTSNAFALNLKAAKTVESLKNAQDADDWTNHPAPVPAPTSTQTSVPSPMPSTYPSPYPTTDYGYCRDLSSRIQLVQTKIRDLQSSTISTLYDVQNVMSSWYYQLSVNEGRTVYIPYGAYDVIRQSAATEGTNARTIDGKFNDLNNQLNSLLADFAHCQ